MCVISTDIFKRPSQISGITTLERERVVVCRLRSKGVKRLKGVKRGGGGNIIEINLDICSFLYFFL